jgi:hypothetical protein
MGVTANLRGCPWEKRFHDRATKASGSVARGQGWAGIPWETISYEVSAKNSGSAPKRERFHWKRFRAIVAAQAMRALIVFGTSRRAQAKLAGAATQGRIV